MAAQGRRFARRVPVEPRFAGLLPEVLLGLGPAQFARLAAMVLAPRPAPQVPTGHIHLPQTSVAEQAAILAARLPRLGRVTFARLTRDCGGTYEVVARFLALLELYREGNVSLEQAEALGDLYVTWVPGARRGGGPAGEEDGE
jgi:segregation and condensation protein A